MSIIKNKLFLNSSDVKNAVKSLKEGKIILYPTDTVWGIGCDYRYEDAVNKIYKIKKRPKTMPLLLIVKDIDMLKKYAPEIHPRVESLLLIHKNPLTLIHKRTKNLPDHILHSDGSIAIRIANHDFCQHIWKHINTPIVSTSANINGDGPPKLFTDIKDHIKSEVDYIVQYEQNNLLCKGESTIACYNDQGELDFIR